MSLSTFFVLVVSGLSGAAILFLIGAGLTLVFGALRVINLAHGTLYMLGAFFAVSIAARLTGPAGFWIAMLAAAAAVGGAGGLIEVAILRRLYRRDHLMQLLATFSLILVIGGIVRVAFGADYHRADAPDYLSGSLSIGSSTVSAYQLFLIGVAIAVAITLWLTIYRTDLGRLIRAAVADPELLALSGVNVPVLFTGVFVIGATLAGLGGASIAAYQTVKLGIDADIVVQAFAVTIIGGLGSLGGALIGAVIVGLVQSFGTYWEPKWQLAFIFLVMAVVLAVRPSGLFGEPER